MKPTFDHFMIVQTQEDVDIEQKRAKAAKNIIEHLQQEKMKKGKIIVTANEDNEIALDINERSMALAHQVKEVAPECTRVKVGDWVLIKSNAMPEIQVFDNKIYYSYSERSISFILDKEDIKKDKENKAILDAWEIKPIDKKGNSDIVVPERPKIVVN